MAIIDGHIRCSDCGDAKPLSEFPPSIAKRGYGVCRLCHNARNLKWTTNNRHKTAVWRLANKHREFERNCLKAKWGLTQADYDAMLSEQSGGCACCGQTVNKSGRRLGVDHDHATGQIRGILCHNCNTGIGHFKDDPNRLRQAIAYLERARQIAPRTAPPIRINLLGAN